MYDTDSSLSIVLSSFFFFFLLPSSSYPTDEFNYFHSEICGAVPTFVTPNDVVGVNVSILRYR